VDLSVTFLGTAASVPTRTRGTAATLIARGGERWLVDCGEGTQRQLLRSGHGLVDVDLILLTHLHADHVLGLPGLLKTYGLRGRERALRIVGPAGLTGFLDRLSPIVGRTPFPLQVTDAGANVVHDTDGAVIEAFHTDHGVPSLGYALLEDDRPGAFDVEAAHTLGVPSGPLFGQLQRGVAVTLDDGTVVRPDQVMGQVREGRTVVVSGDTRPCDATAQIAVDADLLIHEGTFLHDELDRALETRHSTVREAAELAKRCAVRMLALTHLSSRFMPREARAEAEATYARVVIPKDFDTVVIPFRERGEPVLERFEEHDTTPTGVPEPPAA
jgi:ribonuclease Z